ncbi:MAG: FAD-dependent oxidoreductase, partial [Actinomycetales bacterium]
MDSVIVVGAGIAGLACARTLGEAGLPVTVVDRGRKVGGRMASRRLQDRPTDLGAAFFTVSDPRFAAVVDDWKDRDLARPWTSSFTVLDAGQAPGSTSGPVRWGTPGGIRTLAEDLAHGVLVEQGQVTVVSAGDDGALRVDGRPASAVVLAMPDPQARVLL